MTCLPSIWTKISPISLRKTKLCSRRAESPSFLSKIPVLIEHIVLGRYA